MRTRFVLVFCGLVAAASAQVVVPAADAVFDANSQSLFPFLYVDGTRVMAVYHGDQVCTANAIVRGISFRRDMQDNRAFAAATVGPCNIAMGHAVNAPGSLSTDFGSNLAGAMTTVLAGATLNLPALPSGSVFSPFTVDIPFSTPFTYTRSGGHLALDYQVPGRATRKFYYPLDGAYVGTDGQIVQVGDLPQLSMGELLGLWGDASSCVPGGSLTLRVSSLRQPYTALLFIGTATDFHAGLSLPFDMAPLGAPGSHLYTDIQVMLPFPVTASGSRYEGAATLNVPNVRFLAGKKLFAQTAFADTVNPLGVVLSTMDAITIGGMPGSPMVDLIAAPDSAALTGMFFYRGGFGGPVTRLDGTFN